MRLITTALVTFAAITCPAQPPHPEITVDWRKVESRIAWFGTLDGARAVAKREKRPILIISGAPFCRAVPGVW